LQKFLSKDVLPKEFGGDAGALKELHSKLKITFIFFYAAELLL